MGKLKYPLGILLTMVIGALLNMLLCCNCWGDDGGEINATSKTNDIENNGIARTETPELRNPNLVLIDTNGNEIVSSNENFNFLKNRYSHLRPLNASVPKSISAIKVYLDTHEGEQLNITGLYMESEKNTSAFTNLGEARANDVKNYLASSGFDTSRLSISGSLLDNLAVRDSLVLGPVDYMLSKIPQGEAAATREKELDNLAAYLRANPLILHFKTGSSNINLSTIQREKVSKMVKYLDARPSSELASTGHTDNTGSRATNISISAKRAGFAKEYLVKNGINPDRIQSNGKGPDEPIATNNTEEGKAKNRRVVVTIK